MEPIKVCPSTLAEGFDTYSPNALKVLFDGRHISHVLPFCAIGCRSNIAGQRYHLGSEKSIQLSQASLAL